MGTVGAELNPLSLQPVAIAVTASSWQEPNIPANTLDGSLDTRWSAEGSGEWIQFQLGGSYAIDTVHIAFYLGNQRSSSFDLLTSADGATWQMALQGATSSGNTLQLEPFTFPVTANTQYIRIAGKGNASNQWNSITGVAIGTPGSEWDSPDPGELGTWQSSLFNSSWDPERQGSFYTDKLLQDFSHAGYRLGQQPPHIEGPIFNVMDYGAQPRSGDDLEAIQAAIAAAKAAGGGVVYLPEGLYHVELAIGRTIRIDASNIVLRGAGPDKTRIQFSGASYRDLSAILVQGSGGPWLNEANPTVRLSTDLDRPGSVLPLESVAGFAVGQWVVVRTDTTVEWLTEHNQADRWTPDTLSGIPFLRKITRIDPLAKTVTIDIPIRYSLWTRDNARIYPASPHISEVGLEDFSFGFVEHTGSGFRESDHSNPARAAYDLHASYGIRFQRTIDSWVLRVATFQPAVNSRARSHIASNGLLAWEAARLHIEDCYFQRPQYGGAGGNGYMFRFSSNDIRVVNCTTSESRHGFVYWRTQASGNVMERCVDRLTGWQAGATGRERTAGTGSDHHGLFSIANLTDACIGQDSHFDAFYRGYSNVNHDISAAHSVFWNTRGEVLESAVGHLVNSQQARFGYVIGTSGAVNNVRSAGASSTAAARTAPADHVEGVGIGASLYPQSLSAAMRAYRRLRPQSHLTRLLLVSESSQLSRPLGWDDLLELARLQEDWRIEADVEGDFDYIRMDVDFVPINPALISGTAISGQSTFASRYGVRLIRVTPYKETAGRAYPGESYLLRLTIYDYAPGFRQWQLLHFNANQLADPEFSGPNADPDGDGIANVIEYSIGTHPLQPNAYTPFELITANGQFHYRYRIRAELDDVTFSLLRSFDLQTWATIPLIDNNLIEVANGIELRGGRLPYSQTRPANFYLPLFSSSLLFGQ